MRQWESHYKYFASPPRTQSQVFPPVNRTDDIHYLSANSELTPDRTVGVCECSQRWEVFSPAPPVISINTPFNLSRLLTIPVIIIPAIYKNISGDATRMKNPGSDALIASCKPSPVQDTGFQFGRKSDILAERKINTIQPDYANNWGQKYRRLLSLHALRFMRKDFTEWDWARVLTASPHIRTTTAN